MHKRLFINNKIGGGKNYQNDNEESPISREQAIKLAEPLGLVHQTQKAISYGLTPMQALEDWDIVLFSEDGQITPTSAECYRMACGKSIDEILE